MDKKADFFISYNHKDSHWATWIAGVLEENGFSVIIQAWDFRPGSNFVLEMQNALQQSNKTIVVLSKNYVNSDFCLPEWAASFVQDPVGKLNTLIPVRVDDITPMGLFAPIVYIDISDKDEQGATVELLKGIGVTSTLREKPSFPGKSNSVQDSGADKTTYDFLFVIENSHCVEEMMPKVKNAMRDWFTNGCTSEFTVNIHDKRVANILEQNADLQRKIDNEEELSIIEEKRYAENMRIINMCRTEVELKKKACTFFLQDSTLRSYFCPRTYLELYEYVEKILSYDYYNDRRIRSNDFNYVDIDFSLYPLPTECHHYFVVPLKRSAIVEVFGNISNWQIQGDAADLKRDLLKDAYVYYYYFLAEEFICFGFTDLVKNPRVMNLFSYQIGLH